MLRWVVGGGAAESRNDSTKPLRQSIDIRAQSKQEQHGKKNCNKKQGQRLMKCQNECNNKTNTSSGVKEKESQRKRNGYKTFCILI